MIDLRQEFLTDVNRRLTVVNPEKQRELPCCVPKRMA